MKLDGSFTYKPDALFNGTDSFTYKANDGMADSAVVTVTILVNHVNHAPLASDDTYVVAEDGLLSVPASTGLLANDLDVDGDQLLVIIESSPGNGLLQMKLDGSFTYKPNGLFNGTDSFTYKVNDGSEDSNTATVTIKVNHTNHAPLAADDAFSTPRDTLLVVPASGILANDLDVDGDSLFVLIQSFTTHGALGQNLDGSFTYSPAPDFSGTDSFTYMASDGQANSGVVTVTIIVSAVNHAPIAGADSYTVLRDTVLNVDSIRGLLSNDMDPDGNTLTANIVNQPTHGILSATPQGAFTYTPAAGYSGLDSFSYKASDGSLESNVTIVSIDVKFTSSAPVAVDDAYSVPIDTMLQISARNGLLINDSDADGGLLSVIVVTQPSHGTLHLQSDGGFDYIPDAAYSGADSFIYKVNDGAVDSNDATVTINVHAVNRAPTVNSAEFTVFTGEVLQVPEPGLLTTATDPDGDSLKLILVNAPTHGVLTIHPDGSFSYFPDPHHAGPDRFSIRVTDGNASSPTVIISLKVLRLTALPIPALNSWAMLLMALLLFGMAAYRLRIRRGRL